MNTAEYLAAVKTRHQVASDYAVSKLLRVSTQAMSKYKAGSDIPGPLIAFRIADLLNMPRDQVVADLELERAEKAGRVEQIAGWRELVERLGGVAASVLAAVILSGTVGAGNANASGHLARLGGVDGGYIGAHRRRRPGRRRAQVFAAMADALGAGPVRAGRDAKC